MKATDDQGFVLRSWQTEENENRSTCSRHPLLCFANAHSHWSQTVFLMEFWQALTLFSRLALPGAGGVISPGQGLAPTHLGARPGFGPLLWGYAIIALGTRAVSFCNGLFFVVLGLSYTVADGKGLTSRSSGQAACLDYVWFPPVLQLLSVPEIALALVTWARFPGQVSERGKTWCFACR
jgi:hypothetical protein